MLGWIAGLALAGALGVGVTYETIPTGNTDATHFDALIVLGVPSEVDGSPSPEERTHVAEAVREFHAGRADHMILSGGAAHNRWVEAEVMARLAEASGVPAQDVLVEGRSQNTVQNIFYSEQMMKQHGWHSAEVISSPAHLPRTALILEHHDMAWRTHAAPWPPHYSRRIATLYARETLGTMVLRWFGFRRSPYLDTLPAAQRK